MAHQLGRAFTLIDYAYADIGEAITTGQTELGPSSTQKTSIDADSLGWLALGAGR